MDNIVAIEEKLLQKLPAAEAAERLMFVAAPKRLELLLSRTDADAVVAALAPQDFYYFVAELGAESSGPLLSICRTEQFSHIIDVEGWRGDQLSPGKVLTWCARLLATDERNFLAWLYAADFELLVLLFKNWLDEVKAAGDEDYQEESDSLPLHTIDNQFYFSVRYPDFVEVIRFILAFLFEHHPVFYQALLHDVRFALNADVEELAYRFHRGRLEDNAIPSALEARTIYRGMKKHAMGKDKNFGHLLKGESSKTPTFALAHFPAEGIFAAGLDRISDRGFFNNLQQELVSLANKILVADDLEVSDPDNHRGAADKAIAYVNLGLEELCGLDAGQAGETLGRHYLEELFRLGFTCIEKVLAPLRETTQKGWLAQWPEGINILEPNWQEEVSLLVLKTPMRLRKSREGTAGEDHLRFRADLLHIEDLHEMLRELEAVFAAIKQDLGGDFRAYAASLWDKGFCAGLADVTLARLLFTAAARELWQGVWSYRPLPVANWREIHGRVELDGLRKKISQQSASMLPNKKARQLLDRYLFPTFQQFESEMAAGEPPDPRLVPFFLFTKKG